MDSDTPYAGMFQRLNQIGRCIGELPGSATRATEGLGNVLHQFQRRSHVHANDDSARSKAASGLHSSLAAPRGSCSELRGGGAGESPSAASASDAQPATERKKKKKKKRAKVVSSDPVTQHVSPTLPEEPVEALAEPATVKKKKKRDKDVSSKAEPQQASPTTPEELEEALAAGLVSPEQIETIRALAWKVILENETIKVDGKKITGMQLAAAAINEQALHDVGGDEPTMRTMSRAEANARTPSDELRPTAHKMMLRPHEQDQLPLDLLGRGNAFTAAPVLGMRFGGRRNFTYGIYGNGERLTHLLRQKWGGKSPEEVVGQQELYDDLMDVAPSIELTIMALPVRRFTMASMVDHFRSRMSATLKQTPATDAVVDDMRDLDLVADRFTAARFAATGLVDKEGQLVEDSHFIFSIGADAQLDVEALTPGMLQERKAVLVGNWAVPRVGRSLMEQFLGDDPVDVQAKIQVGNALMMLANDFDLHSTDPESNLHLLDETGSPKFLQKQPQTEMVEATFSLSKRSRKRRALLDRISSRQPWQRKEMEDIVASDL